MRSHCDICHYHSFEIQTLPDNDHHEADEEERNPEAGPASALARRRARGKQDLEAEGEKMHHVVTQTRVVEITPVHFDTGIVK